MRIRASSKNIYVRSDQFDNLSAFLLNHVFETNYTQVTELIMESELQMFDFLRQMLMIKQGLLDVSWFDSGLDALSL